MVSVSLLNLLLLLLVRLTSHYPPPKLVTSDTGVLKTHLLLLREKNALAAPINGKN